MKRTAILLATTAAFIAAPAQAREGGLYLGIEGGLSSQDEVDIDLATTDPQTNLAFGDTNNGVDADIVLGYDFGAFRLEAEAGYKRSGIDEVTILNPGLTPGLVTTPQTFNAPDASLTILSGMVNAIFEVGSDDGLQVFAGGGIGIADADLQIDLGQGTGFFIDDSGSDLAYQGIAGIRYPVTDRIDIGLKYRYFVIDEFEIQAPGGEALEFDHQTHSVLASILFNFGGRPAPVPEPIQSIPAPAPTPPPPPPPVRQPAPPPPPPPCNTGPYIVFFDFDEAVITADAASILDSAITAYANCGTARVMLAGHTDRSGSTAYNMGLAQRRNASVQQYLSGRGIPASRISGEAFGESQPRVPTADGVRELQNRRVEVTYGPGSGM